MKSICIFFKGLSVAKSCLRPDSVPLKADQQISKKGCLKKYYSCDRACQVSALEGTPWQSYLKNLTTGNKFINKQVQLFIYQAMCWEEKIISML